MSIIEFSAWLQAELDKRNLKASAVAEKGNVDPAIISRALSRERMPSAESLVGIAIGLGVSRETVFRAAGYIDEPPEMDRLKERVLYLLEKLPQNQQEVVADFAEFLMRQHESSPRKQKPADGKESVGSA